MRTVTQQADAAGEDAPHAVAARLEEGVCIDGRYRVERLLGEGGGGAVYLVRHEGLDGARFALKVLHGAEGRSDALAREGRLAAEVRSAHVVKVVELGRMTNGEAFLVMEYVEGPTLAALLETLDLTTPVAMECARQLCLALEDAHGRGLVHGDLSARNVFATTKPDGALHVQLGDFGLARRVRRDDGATRSAAPRAGLGTPRFASPEALAGEALDARSDVFSAGVLLYRLLTGAYPFDGATPREVLAATLRGDAVAAGQRRPAARAFEPLLARCLAADPAARVPSARALREALDGITPGPAPRPRPRPLRARGIAAAVCLTALAAAGAHRWQRTSTLPLGERLACPDTALDRRDPELAHAVAQSLCARVGAPNDLDWGGGPGATEIRSDLTRDRGAYRLTVRAAGRVVEASGATPLDAVGHAAAALRARVRGSDLPVEEVRRWGARDAATAREVRALWRRRTTLLLDDYEAAPRALLARDPDLPLVNLLVAEVDQDLRRSRDAATRALAAASRLPDARALALRAWVALRRHDGLAAESIDGLRRAYNAAPNDVDIGVLYVESLMREGMHETALAESSRLRTLAPRHAALAFHHAATSPWLRPGEPDLPLAWLLEARPEARASTAAVCALLDEERVDAADEALSFGRRLGVREDALAIPESMVALALGDPARIERATRALEGSPQTWTHRTGVRLRAAGLMIRGLVAEAGAYLARQVALRRAAHDVDEALLLAGYQLELARHTGVPALDEETLTWLDGVTRGQPPSQRASVRYQSERAARRASGDGAARELERLDGAILAGAGASAAVLDNARLATLAIAARARGDAEVVRRWEASRAATRGAREVAAYDAARAMERLGDLRGAEAAYRLAISAHELERHAFAAAASRARLAALLDAQGRGAEARALRSFLGRAWRDADPARLPPR